MPLLQPGSLFANRFEIDRAAGAGGMGTVYRAVDRYSGDPVALKLLSTQAASPAAAAEAQRFIREAELLAELRHPGIVSYVAHGQTPDGQCFLAMEWLDGQDLAQRLARGPLPLLDALALLSRIAQGLSLAHQRGVLHRDINKPKSADITQSYGRWGTREENRSAPSDLGLHSCEPDTLLGLSERQPDWVVRTSFSFKLQYC
ncbi:MAG TPA: protein kinase [Pseudomonadota bacterium]|nr:protein kinase [Pseudomonadota bacterium]